MRRRSPSTMVAMAIQLRAPCGQSANNQISAKTPLQPHCSLPHFEVLPQDIEIVLRARDRQVALRVDVFLPHLIGGQDGLAVRCKRPREWPDVSAALTPEPAAAPVAARTITAG